MAKKGIRADPGVGSHEHLKPPTRLANQSGRARDVWSDIVIQACGCLFEFYAMHVVGIECSTTRLWQGFWVRISTSVIPETTTLSTRIPKAVRVVQGA